MNKCVNCGKPVPMPEFFCNTFCFLEAEAEVNAGLPLVEAEIENEQINQGLKNDSLAG